MPRAGLDHRIVIAAAAVLADSEGLEAVTLGALAKKLGVRIPSLYNHIDGLPGLRRDLTRAGAQALAQSLMQAVLGKSGDTAILALAHAYRVFAASHPGLYAASLQVRGTEDQELERINMDVVSIMEALLAPYGLQGTNALHAIRGLRSVVHGFVSMEAAGGFGMPFSCDESFQFLVEVFIAGLHQGRFSHTV